jgi:hypothetical protein
MPAMSVQVSAVIGALVNDTTALTGKSPQKCSRQGSVSVLGYGVT